MTYSIGPQRPQEKRLVIVKIVDAAQCLREISAALARRAYEIYRSRGGNAGHELEDWQLAEKEILQPLCCGMLESKDGVTVSAFCSSCGAKDLEEIEVCVEPHRLILVGTRRSPHGSGENIKVYRVLTLEEETDPSSTDVTMAQHGALLEVHIRKLHKQSLTESKAA